MQPRQVAQRGGGSPVPRVDGQQTSSIHGTIRGCPHERPMAGRTWSCLRSGETHSLFAPHAFVFDQFENLAPIVVAGVVAKKWLQRLVVPGVRCTAIVLSHRMHSLDGSS